VFPRVQQQQQQFRDNAMRGAHQHTGDDVMVPAGGALTLTPVGRLCGSVVCCSGGDCQQSMKINWR